MPVRPGPVCEGPSPRAMPGATVGSVCRASVTGPDRRIRPRPPHPSPGTPAPHLRQLHRTISSGPMGSSAKLLVRICLPGWFVVQPEPRAVPALEGFGPACPPPPGPNNLCEVAVYTHYFYACSARGWPRATLQETPAPSGSLQIIGCKEATCPRTVKVPIKSSNRAHANLRGPAM